jgi:hypothetical protein
MDPYEYDDMLAEVWEQVPPGVQQWVKLAIQCDDTCAGPRIAIFTTHDGIRSWRFELQPNGLITDEAIWHLCAFV